jgi:hypothetical protein
MKHLYQQTRRCPRVRIRQFLLHTRFCVNVFYVGDDGTVDFRSIGLDDVGYSKVLRGCIRSAVQGALLLVLG